MSHGRRIARVKLISPSPAAAKKYLLEWDNRSLFHTPNDYPKLKSEILFKQPGPMVLEIGCGTGEFLLSSASAQPQDRFIGVEISRRAIYHAVNQAESLKLDNIKFIKADIRLLYPLMELQTWKMIHLIYPDPNYSAGRRKHRIFSSEFLDVCHNTLTNEGKISVVTDQLPFLHDMLEIAEKDARFVKTHASRYMEGFSPEQKTRYQKAWERFNRSNYYFEIQKKSRI